MTNKNLSIYALIALFSLQLQGMNKQQQINKQLRKPNEFKFFRNNNQFFGGKKPPLINPPTSNTIATKNPLDSTGLEQNTKKRPSNDILTYQGLEKKAKTEIINLINSQEESTTQDITPSLSQDYSKAKIQESQSLSQSFVPLTPEDQCKKEKQESQSLSQSFVPLTPEDQHRKKRQESQSLSQSFVPLTPEDQHRMERQESQNLSQSLVSQGENRQREPLPITLSDKIQRTITNFDFNTLGNLLITNEAAQLNKEQKEELYLAAKEKMDDFEKLCELKNKFATQSDKQEIKREFSLNHDHTYKKNIQNISHHLYALKTLPKLTFPQAFFTNAPYVRDLPPKTTPDQALIALIKNEQRKISISCFSFDLMSIAQALVCKKKSGVKIELITDTEQGKRPKALEVIKLLKENGIEILSPQNHNYEKNHHKFSLFKQNLFNKPLLCNGSFNYSNNAKENCWEDMTISDDPEIVKDFNARFKEVKGRSKEFRISQPISQQNSNNSQNNSQKRLSQ